jgi:hypothetical protein
MTNGDDRDALHHDCECFNAAFLELGFEWQWDPELYASLGRISGERERVATYVREHQPHLLRAYDLGFLCDVILAARRQHRPPLAAAA